jgi:hypothetical protein
MIEVFKAKRSTFDALRSDLCGLSHDQTIWTDSGPAPPLPAKTLAFYQNLLNDIGANRISSLPASYDVKQFGKHSCIVDVTGWSDGMLDSGNSKDWYFGRGPNSADDLDLKSLDAIDFKHTMKRFPQPSHHGHRTYWRHLEGDWWLQWDHWE